MLFDSGQVWKEHVSTGTRWTTQTFCCCCGRFTRCLCCQPSIGWLSIWAPRESWSRTSSKLDLKGESFASRWMVWLTVWVLSVRTLVLDPTHRSRLRET